MCGIANLFDKNIAKFDAKKHIYIYIYFFFCPEWLNCANHWEKLIFSNNKISVLEVEL